MEDQQLWGGLVSQVTLLCSSGQTENVGHVTGYITGHWADSLQTSGFADHWTGTVIDVVSLVLVIILPIHSCLLARFSGQCMCITCTDHSLANKTTAHYHICICNKGVEMKIIIITCK